MEESTIYVLAGVNGSGKSSILGAAIRSKGGEFFNPDTYTAELITVNPGLTLQEAQGEAWKFGRESLETAISNRGIFAFETTLGGKTITRILLEAALSETKISIFYIGLNSVDLNIQRVADRVKKKGHNIPTDKIRQRWFGSVENIVRLLPYLNELRVYDNSESVTDGSSPKAKLLINISNGIIDGGMESILREDFTEWAEPIAMSAIDAFTPKSEI